MKFLIFISIILAHYIVQCDLPVHCTKKQILGQWQILETQEMDIQEYSIKNSLNKKYYSKQPITCGHHIPDYAQESYKSNTQSQFLNLFNMTLYKNDTAVLLNQDQQIIDQGKWTMVYDEGFQVEFNDKTYFWFSKYEPIPKTRNKIQEKILQNLQKNLKIGVDGEQNNQNNQSENIFEIQNTFISMCNETIIGWVYNKINNKTGCSKSIQISQKPNENLENIKTKWTEQGTQIVSKEDIPILQYNDDNSIKNNSTNNNDGQNYNGIQVIQGNENKKFLEKKNKIQEKVKIQALLSYNETLQEQNYNNKQQINKKLNEENNVQHKQKHKKNKNKQKNQMNQHDNFVKNINKNVKNDKWQAKVTDNIKNLNFKQLNQKAGRKQQNKPKKIDLNYEKYKTYKSFSLEDISDLPLYFSWEEYLNPLQEQGECGSCYTITTMNMLSMRLKIFHNENVTLSVQQVLDCNFYNQGCDGGYPFLVSKFGSEYELFPEYCSPYSGNLYEEIKPEDEECYLYCDPKQLKKTYKVQDYGYIGGSYGKTTERSIMEEIMNNGPVILNIEPSQDLMYYEKGVYHIVDVSEWIIDGESQPQWEKVDHSVLCYGWGQTEEGEKYWLLQNSWGSDWGENGNFRIRRGTDESGVESMGEYANPVIIYHDKQDKRELQQNYTVKENNEQNFDNLLDFLNIENIVKEQKDVDMEFQKIEEEFIGLTRQNSHVKQNFNTQKFQNNQQQNYEEESQSFKIQQIKNSNNQQIQNENVQMSQQQYKKLQSNTQNLNNNYNNNTNFNNNNKNKNNVNKKPLQLQQKKLNRNQNQKQMQQSNYKLYQKK